MWYKTGNKGLCASTIWPETKRIFNKGSIKMPVQINGKTKGVIQVESSLSKEVIIDLVKKVDKELIKDVRIFDVYQGDNIESGKKSIAFNVTLEPKDKTLSDNEIEEVSKKIISKVEKTTGATLRS